jgi:membrane associated rhomboid family serine protease
MAGVLVALVACFVLFTLSPLKTFASAHLVLVPQRALKQPWTLLTSAFLHGSLGGLASSGLGLWFFGGPLGEAVGRRRLAIVLLVATVLGSLASALLGLKLHPTATLYGAAPATTAAIAGFGVVYAGTPVRLFGLQELRASTVAGVFLILSGVLYLMGGDLLGLAGAGAGAAVGAASTMKLDIGFLRQPLKRLHRWRIRRRYRVIPGGRDWRRFSH